MISILPRKMRFSLKRSIEQSGLKISVMKFIVGSAIISLILSFFLGFGAREIGAPLKFAIPLLFVICFFSCYMFLQLRADARLQFVENALPDALDLMAANLRAGLTTDRALILASRPEFGPLQEELDLIGREIALGRNIVDALQSFASRTSSDRIKKTVALIVSGLRSGGKLAELLTQASTVLKQQAAVQSKVASTVTVHIIFIFSTVIAGAPFLFAVTAFLVETMSGLLKSIPQSNSSEFTSIAFSGTGLPTQQVVLISALILCTIGIMSSLFAGQIANGKPRTGLKYAPLLLGASLAVFFLARIGIRAALGSIFGAQ